MKKYIGAALLLFILAGCGMDNSNTNEETTNENKTEETTNNSNKQSNENNNSLEDGTYEGKSEVFKPYETTAKYTVEDGQITEVIFDEFLEDGTSKKEASKAGEYGSENYTAGEWYEQIEKLENYVEENQEMPDLTDGKDTDGVSGATLNLSGFEDAFNQAKLVE